MGHLNILRVEPLRIVEEQLRRGRHHRGSIGDKDLTQRSAMCRSRIRRAVRELQCQSQ